jgi:molecular chaperone Hsp33
LTPNIKADKNLSNNLSENSHNLYRAITKDASATVTILDGKNIVSEIEKIHKPSAVVTAALGRLSIASSLMGYNLKSDGESITIRINGGGEIGNLLAVSDSNGNVKSYADNYIVELPLNKYGKLDVGTAVGKDGVLAVAKDLNLKEPYVSQVPIISGEIAEDIASYFVISEQTPTVCALGVLVAPDLTVETAGGYLIHLLPFTPDEVITKIEENVNSLPPMTELLKTKTPPEIADLLFKDLEPEFLDSAEVGYKCDCSRQRTEEILITLGKEELEKLSKEQEITEVACHFCDKKYAFTPQELLNLAE